MAPIPAMTFFLIIEQLLIKNFPTRRLYNKTYKMRKPQFFRYKTPELKL